MRSTVTLVLGCLISILPLGWPPTSNAQDEPYPEIELPVFDSGFAVIREINPSLETKSLHYRIRVDQPPADVLEFYDAFFIGRGWISSFEICQRHWDDCPDTELVVTGAAKQMYAAWKHPGKKLQAKLWLIYPQDAAKSKDVIVRCWVGWTY